VRPFRHFVVERSPHTETKTKIDRKSRQRGEGSAIALQRDHETLSGDLPLEYLFQVRFILAGGELGKDDLLKFACK
jgi:hypothetical protein